MKNEKANALFHHHSSTAASPRASGLLALTALLLCGLAVSTAAQTNSSVKIKIAQEKGFTLTPGVSTPIVLKTLPGAVCELHGEDAQSKSLRFFANGDGYLKIHARPEQESQEARVQLDCAGKNGEAVRYPLHVRGSLLSTEDMPAPQTEMPTLSGSTIRPALTAAEAQSLSAEELGRRGYPFRPDASADPESYQRWLEEVTREMTILPASKMGPSRLRHGGVQAGGDQQSYNWSGFISFANKRIFPAVSGYWNVPEMFHCEANTNTSSAFWIGIDGFNLSDLAQAGSEQDCTNSGGVNFYNYYTWQELLPNEPTEQPQFPVNPGDHLYLKVMISAGNGPDINGSYFGFGITDTTQGITTGATYIPLDGTYINASETEWIMERPCLNYNGVQCLQFAELSDYNYAYMNGPTAQMGNQWYPYTKLPGLTELWMYNDQINGKDNNLLSKATNDGSNKIYYQWENYH